MGKRTVKGPGDVTHKSLGLMESKWTFMERLVNNCFSSKAKLKGKLVM